MALKCLCKAAGAAAFAFLVGFCAEAQAGDSGFYVGAGAEDLARSEIKAKKSSLRAAGLPDPEMVQDFGTMAVRLMSWSTAFAAPGKPAITSKANPMR